ncbi:MAG: hypothetical protein Q7J09_05270 [Methanocalculus sp.]|uniref:hypothetical protein n=1 Tax=Methanocalculus sp. TaxID=2004547 RepID=UPI0027252DAE|nr:hypothetical protein [Methanocalculus sp.]MDO9539396.1 hypothetical protein [Methanocalculus sp.]
MANPEADDDPIRAHLRIDGGTVAEKCVSPGVTPGTRIALSELRKIREKYGGEVYLFFDDWIARNSTMKDDLENYAMLPPEARPYLEIERFFKVVKEQQIPLPDENDLMAEIITVGELDTVVCCSPQSRPFIRALLSPI